MRRWSVTFDIKLVWRPFFILTLFLLWLSLSDQFSYISTVNQEPSGFWVGTRLLFFFEFCLSIFIIIISGYFFEDVCKPVSFSFLRSLPLNIWSVWLSRYLKLLVAFCILVFPFLAIALEQVNYGISVSTAFFTDLEENISLYKVPIFISVVLCINLHILSTHALLILCKNKIFVTAILVSYNLMELGPWGSFLQENAIFWGIRLLPVNPSVFPNTYSIALVEIILFFFIFLWYKHNFST